MLYLKNKEEHATILLFYVLLTTAAKFETLFIVVNCYKNNLEFDIRAKRPTIRVLLNISQLIEKCKQKDRNAQKQLYTQYKDILFSICLKYAKNRMQAEDNLQDSFVTIFEKIDSYKGNGSFEGWMKRITINKAIDKYKKEPYFDSIDDRQVANDAQVDEDQTHIPIDQLLEFVQQLPSRYRLVFNMYQLDGFSHKDISKALDISIGTSKSNYHRAKIILKEKITAYNLTINNSIVNG